MSRIDDIKAFALKKEEEQNAKELAQKQRIEGYKAQIIALKPRIDELIETANVCIENGITLEIADSNQTYDRGQFVTNSWSHLLGFVYNRHKKERIAKLGIYGGGCCHFNLETDGVDILLEGRDIEYVLKQFVERFDEFESKFYAYVDRVIKMG